MYMIISLPQVFLLGIWGKISDRRGGIIKGFLESSPVLNHFMPFAGIRLLYPVSTAGILLLQIGYCYGRRKKKGDNNERN